MANVRHAWLYMGVIRAMRDKFKLSSDSGNSCSKKCKQGYGGVWQSLRLVGTWSLESAGRFWVGSFETAFYREGVFMFNLL
jgi:hypothetical protein